LFSPRATTVYRLFLFCLALLVLTTGTAAYAYFHSNYWNRIGMAPPQPILFSHRHHAGELRIDCRNCHATVETSSFAGMPATHTCLTCHSQIFADTVMIQPLVRSAVERKPLRWTWVSRLPSYVFFDHGIHVRKGVACATCHGDVGSMALTAKQEPLTMRWCLDCHRDPGPRLSQPSEVFSAFRVGKMPSAERRQLLDVYQVRTDSLTDCATCHH
jgi:formate-dependent nitrite reductase cytochrome c552 subunit